jgi:predicted Zn-dependent protease
MNEEVYIGFESYLNNEMPPEEKEQFEDKLKTDSEFSKSFALYKETTQFLNHKFATETLDFKQNLQSISKDYFAENQQEQAKVIVFKPWYYAVAASVAVLLGTWFFMQNATPSYGDFNLHENAYFMERGEADANLKAAQDFFNAKEYNKAVTAFEKVQATNNPEIQYFYAIALIETNKYQKAEALLNNIQQGSSAYKDKALWYLALSKLKQDKGKECKSFLKQIPKDAEDYEKAQQLLKKLD